MCNICIILYIRAKVSAVCCLVLLPMLTCMYCFVCTWFGKETDDWNREQHHGSYNTCKTTHLISTYTVGHLIWQELILIILSLLNSVLDCRKNSMNLSPCLKSAARLPCEVAQLLIHYYLYIRTIN